MRAKTPDFSLVSIVVVAPSIESGEWDAALTEALWAGALTGLEKPVGTIHADYHALAERLYKQLVIMSQVKRFQSIARDRGAGALSVLLTGMGEDGATGLLASGRSGGYTIAEDESTAVVLQP